MARNNQLDHYIWNNPNFPNKTTEDEDIILLVREDLIVIVIKGILLYLLFFVMLILRAVVSGFADLLSISIFDTLLYSLGLLLSLIFLIIFHNYYLSLQIITSERIIDIDQTSLFRREVSSTPIGRIEDVTHRKKNLATLIFNFGDVIVQTAGRSGFEAPGGIGGFVFKNVPNPAEIAHLIDTLMQKDRLESGMERAREEATKLQRILDRKTLN